MMRCKIVAYTDENDQPIEPFDRVMLFIGEDPDEPQHVLDNIPLLAAATLHAVINGNAR